MKGTSKISRFPRRIRDDLNHRFDSAEPGKTILKWLNSQPEVQQILNSEFKGEPVNKQNLSNWKQSGFRHWQLRRSALEFAADDADAPAAEQALSGSITRNLAHWVSLRYAAALHSLPPPDGDPQSELQQLNDLCDAVVALRRGDLSAERVLLEQKRLALLESAAGSEREKLFWEWTTRPEVQAKLHPQRDPDLARREAERMLNYRLLGIPLPNHSHEDPAPAALI